MGSCSWRVFIAGLILLFHGFSSTVAEKPPNYSFVHEATAAPEISYYDYIIVGGGTAGCPLAATLSHNARVLLLERGRSPYTDVNVTELRFQTNNFADSSPNSAAQPFTSEDGVSNFRPRVLGGGSAINSGFYSHAESSFIHDLGLDEKLVNRSYKWVERAVVHEPHLGPWQTAARAAMLEAGILPDNGHTYDHLIGTKTSGTIFDRNGMRSSAAYLLQYARPSRITVFLHATVQNISFEMLDDSKPRAVGVVFKDASGVLHQAYLTKSRKSEVILSAGALGSPQLLLLSGIGPKKQLEEHNISVVLDHPSVGQGMADNPSNLIFVPLVLTSEISYTLSVGITSFGSYIEAASGLNFVGGTPSDYMGFDYKKGGFILEKVKGPKSRGFLELRNRDPSDNPRVTFNYFQDPSDLEACVRGVETMLKMVETRAMSSIRNTSVSVQQILDISANLPHSLPNHDNTSTSLEQFCKDTVGPIYHYHGGCLTGSVVDNDYKVIGVDGLRVLDGSTFHISPGANPQATVMMLGRYVGIQMLRERRTTKGNQ